ncbi:MAG TPA: hypothetical protein VGF96_19320 [Terracidiphilus sp.]
MPPLATISFKRFCCGLFLIHSIRFDLIALTVDLRNGSQFTDVRHDDLIAELLPLLSGPDLSTLPLNVKVGSAGRTPQGKAPDGADDYNRTQKQRRFGQRSATTSPFP